MKRGDRVDVLVHNYEYFQLINYDINLGYLLGTTLVTWNDAAAHDAAANDDATANDAASSCLCPRYEHHNQQYQSKKRFRQAVSPVL